MNRNKFYIILIVGLLLTNLILIGFMVFPKGHKGQKRGSREGPRHAIIEKLNLSTDQAVSYRELIDTHRKRINEKDKEIRNLKRGLYQGLKSEKSVQADSLIGAINAVQREIEQLRYKHFEDLKALCTAEQLGDYNELVDDIGKLFRKKREKK